MNFDNSISMPITSFLFTSFVAKQKKKVSLSLSLSLSQKKLNSLHIFHVVSKYVYS